MVYANDLSEIYFDVRKLDSKIFLKDLEIVDAKSHIIYIPGKKKILNFVSESYKLIKNQCILDPIINRLAEIYGKEKLTVQYLNIDDRKFYVDIIIKSNSYEILRRDFILPRISIYNSYDNSIPPTVYAGLYRTYSKSKLLALDFPVFSLRHRGNHTKTEIEVQKIGDALLDVVEKYPLLKTLSEKIVSKKELASLIHAIKSKSNFPKRKIVFVKSILNKEGYELKTSLNCWIVYNAFNQLLNHSTKLNPEFRAKIDREVFSIILNFYLE